MTVSTYDENCRLRARLKLAPADIEEAVARCGWTVLNDAEDVTDEDRAEVDRLERQGYAQMTTGTGAEALAWWNARKIEEA